MKRLPGWLEVVAAAVAVLMLVVLVVYLGADHPRNVFSNISGSIGT